MSRMMFVENIIPNRPAPEADIRVLDEKDGKGIRDISMKVLLTDEETKTFYELCDLIVKRTREEIKI